MNGGPSYRIFSSPPHILIRKISCEVSNSLCTRTGRRGQTAEGYLARFLSFFLSRENMTFNRPYLVKSTFDRKRAVGKKANYQIGRHSYPRFICCWMSRHFSDVMAALPGTSSKTVKKETTTRRITAGFRLREYRRYSRKWSQAWKFPATRCTRLFSSWWCTCSLASSNQLFFLR